MDGHASEHKSHFKEYMVIFFLLSLFTGIELMIPNSESLSKVAKGVSLTFFACLKAWLVAYFYMHLKDEKAWLKFIAAIPLVAGLFAYVLVIESQYR